MKKTFCYLLFVASLGLSGCASYPNYYIKDSTITNQQQTTQNNPGWGVVPYSTSPVYYVPPVYGWGTGGWWGPGGWGWGNWNNGWWNGGGCW